METITAAIEKLVCEKNAALLKCANMSTGGYIDQTEKVALEHAILRLYHNKKKDLIASLEAANKDSRIPGASKKRDVSVLESNIDALNIVTPTKMRKFNVIDLTGDSSDEEPVIMTIKTSSPLSKSTPNTTFIMESKPALALETTSITTTPPHRMQQVSPNLPSTAHLKAWHRNDHKKLRDEMNVVVFKLLRPRWPNHAMERLLMHFNKLERSLYHGATSLQEYTDPATLEHRLNVLIQQRLTAVGRTIESVA